MTRGISRLNTAQPVIGSQVDQPLAVRWIDSQLQNPETIDRPLEIILPKILHEGDPLPSCHRLVVLVPDCEINLNELARKIGDLAAKSQSEVFLLTVPEHPDYKYLARRSISILAADIRYKEKPVQIRVDSGGSYLEAVKTIVQPGDMLVCYAGMSSTEIGKRLPFIEVLAKTVRLPVYALEGTLPRRKAHLSFQVIDLLLIAACLATIISFFGIQVWLDHNLIGIWKTLLEIVSVLVEIRVITLIAALHF